MLEAVVLGNGAREGGEWWCKGVTEGGLGKANRARP